MRVRREDPAPTPSDVDGFAVVAVALIIVTACAGTGCAPVVKRDLSRIPAGQVGFDDMCDLQAYFDGLASKKLAAPALISSSELQRTDIERDAKKMSGQSRFAFETDFQLQVVRRLLEENWKRLPEGLAKAPRIDLEVWWSEKSGLRRVISSENATLIVARRSTALPYHVCLSELLFGEALYRQRRELLGPAPAQISSMPERDGGGSPRDAGGPDASGGG